MIKLAIYIIGISLCLMACAPKNQFGNVERDNEQDARLLELERRMDVLEERFQASVQDFADLEASGLATAAQLNTMQTILETQQASITVLQTQEAITEFIDPCGDGPGFDEVLIRTTSGQLVAYFESGGNRFLTILSPGSYATTDAQRCHFQLTAEGKVI